MCGDVGDPIYCKHYVDIVSYIKDINPDIHVFTITNGSHKKPDWWANLASVLNHRDTVNFSVDGYDAISNNQYRINSDFDSIVNGIKSIRSVNRDVFLNWATIVFSFNQDHLDRIKSIATKLNMDGLQITKSTKFGSKYGDAYGGNNDPLEPREGFISSSHRYERELINLSGRSQNYQDYLDINRKNYFEVKKNYSDQPIVPLCEIGNRGVYVNAEGVMFPCSWTSFPYHILSHANKVIQWQDSFFAKYRDRMNLNNRSLQEIIRDPLWSKCSDGWRDTKKTWVECSQKCSQQLVDENYAVGWLTN